MPRFVFFRTSAGSWTTLHSESFTAADLTPVRTLTGWADPGSDQNLVRSNRMDTQFGAFTKDWIAATHNNDQRVSATFVSLLSGGGNKLYLIARADFGAGTGYSLLCNSGGYLTLYRSSGDLSTGTELMNFSVHGDIINDGDVVMLECEGTAVRVKKNGTILSSFTDATYASGKCGVGSDGSCTLDDLLVEHK